jgi:DNA ligase (NAD+)
MTASGDRARREHERLSREIAAHNHRYYVLDDPTVSDAEYDVLFRALQTLEAEHPELVTPESPTQRIGAAARTGVVKHKHTHRMYSLDNSYSYDELREFDRRVRDGLGRDSVQYMTEPKIDGASVELVYRAGKLALALTRGDGEVGEDITPNVRTIRSVPLQIPFEQELIVRGEVVMYRRDLAAINDDRVAQGQPAFANPRNASSGSLRLLDPQLTAQRPLRVFLYEVVAPVLATQQEVLELLASLALPTHRRHRLCEGIDEAIAVIDAFAEARKKLPYDTDGVVLKVNRTEDQRALGVTARFPRWAVAYKYTAERAETRVLSITCDVGRTGALTPVANLEPVHLSGTTVSRASLHNLDYIAAKDVRVGDWVWIEKAGEIIPQVVEVQRGKRPAETAPWQAPTHCPACGHPASREQDAAALRCTNARCPGRLKALVFYFTRRTGMNIERLGRALIEQLVDHGLLVDLADIFALPDRRAELLTLERMADKSVDEVIASIEEARTTRTTDRFIAALGIPLVGAVVAKRIAEHYPSLTDLLAAHPGDVQRELEQSHGIGPKIAESVAQYLNDPATRGVLGRFAQLGVQTIAAEPAATRGPFAGHSFCVTGTLSEPRTEVHKYIESMGGIVHTKVSKGTTYLVVGEKVGQSKIDAATKLGTRVITEAELRGLHLQAPAAIQAPAAESEVAVEPSQLPLL